MYTVPLRFTKADDAAASFIRHGARYKRIISEFAEMAGLWRTVAERHLKGAITLEPSSDDSSNLAGTALGQPFSIVISPVLIDGEVIGKIVVSKKGLDGSTIICATYLSSFHTPVLLENGEVLFQKNIYNFELLWLCHIAESVLTE